MSGNPGPDYFERKDSGEGFGDQLMRFSQPLIAAANGEIDKIDKAMTLGMIFWNMAISGEELEAAFSGYLKDLVPAGVDAAEFRALAADMVARHMKMFPALHAKRRTPCASTAG
jgi:hypothetical protein